MGIVVDKIAKYFVMLDGAYTKMKLKLDVHCFVCQDLTRFHKIGLM